MLYLRGGEIYTPPMVNINNLGSKGNVSQNPRGGDKRINDLRTGDRTGGRVGECKVVPEAPSTPASWGRVKCCVWGYSD